MEVAVKGLIITELTSYDWLILENSELEQIIVYGEF